MIPTTAPSMPTARMQAVRLDKTDIRDVYTSLAPIYDVRAHLTEERARARALEVMAIRDGESVLDVAVGTGVAFERIVLANPSGRTDGVDLTPAMLARAKARMDRAGARGRFSLEVGDAYALPFEDERFDVVHNAYMFDLLPERDFPRVLGEMVRVLRPGGRLVLANMALGDRWFQQIPERLYRLHPRLMGGCRGVALAPFVLRAGLHHVERETVAQFGFPSEIVSAVRPRAAA